MTQPAAPPDPSVPAPGQDLEDVVGEDAVGEDAVDEGAPADGRLGAADPPDPA